MNKQNESSGMRLLSSGKRGFFRIVFSRVGLIALLLILQVALIFAVMLWFTRYCRICSLCRGCSSRLWF